MVHAICKIPLWFWDQRNGVDGIKWHQVPQWESVKVIIPDDFKILVSNYLLHHRASCFFKCVYTPMHIFASRNPNCNYSSLPLIQYHDNNIYPCPGSAVPVHPV